MERNISYVRNKNLVSKLTITQNGDIRIKIEKGITREEEQKVLKLFRLVYESEEMNNIDKTFRGSCPPSAEYITMRNNNKKENYLFSTQDQIRA